MLFVCTFIVMTLYYTLVSECNTVHSLHNTKSCLDPNIGNVVSAAELHQVLCLSYPILSYIIRPCPSG